MRTKLRPGGQRANSVSHSVNGPGQAFLAGVSYREIFFLIYETEG